MRLALCPPKDLGRLLWVQLEGAEVSSLQGFDVTIPVSSLAMSLCGQPPFYWICLGWLFSGYPETQAKL